MIWDGMKTFNLENTSKWIGIIGSRDADEEELQAAFDFAKKSALKGFIVVSGLAVGIDTQAHLGALAGGGDTIAILSTSQTEQVFPEKNKALADRIRNQGALLHPFTVKANWSSNEKGLKQPQKRLIERDILLASLCPFIVSVKRGGKISGGTKWATHWGMKYGKKVVRLGLSGEYEENPDCEPCKIWWEPELKLQSEI
jgi:predicted Rossmann fold nucleotide-binding protein DprA/Smf involved in DNA uptake